eukprot:TRINITY_DN2007_c0_g1_i6.p1 TRINITY_DN2007_c0_g1~~TRINITY_DN2007_c0_g1_i6.p1  ORF type:complete len:248 (-),score=34.90 TRINITY_DN2007_c0_g1_i6:40-783(-)
MLLGPTGLVPITDPLSIRIFASFLNTSSEFYQAVANAIELGNAAFDSSLITLWNSRAWRDALVTSGNAHTTTRALAHIAAVIAGGGALEGTRYWSEKAQTLSLESDPVKSDQFDYSLFQFTHLVAAGWQKLDQSELNRYCETTRRIKPWPQQVRQAWLRWLGWMSEEEQQEEDEEYKCWMDEMELGEKEVFYGWSGAGGQALWFSPHLQLVMAYQSNTMHSFDLYDARPRQLFYQVLQDFRKISKSA